MEKANAKDNLGAAVVRGASFSEEARAEGFYTVECRDVNGELKWKDTIKNVVTTEGKDAALTHFFKGSAYTAVNFMGLIGATSYVSVPVVGNTMASHATWVEAVSGIAATRQTPTLGTAAAGALATSSNASFSILGTETIKGCFVAIKSGAGVAPTSAPLNTAGALYSAGLFSGGDKAVGNGDTLTVSYTASL